MGAGQVMRALCNDQPAGGSLPPGALSDREQARRHLFAIMPVGLEAGEWYELRALDTSVRPAAPGPRRYFRSITDLVEEAMRLRERWDVFFGVGLRRCLAHHDLNRCPHESKGMDHVARISTAWADLDVASEDEPGKPHASVPDLLETLLGTETPPRVIVGSGHGVHAYWPLGTATHELPRVEALNRSISRRLGGDHAIDAARVLRLAGTFSYKHGERLPVSLLRCAHE